MKNCISSQHGRMGSPWARLSNPQNRPGRQGRKILRTLGVFLLAVSVLLGPFLFASEVKAAQEDGISLTQVLETEQGRQIQPSEDGTCPFTMEEQDGYLKMAENLRVNEVVELDFFEIRYLYDDLAYLLAAQGPKTVTLVLRLDQALTTPSNVQILEGNAEVISVDSHDSYLSIALNVGACGSLKIGVPAKISERAYETIRYGYTFESRLCAVMWGGYVLNESAVKAAPLTIRPAADDSMFDISMRSTDLASDFTANVALELEQSKVSPMDMVLIADKHEGAAGLDQYLATLKKDLIDAGINLHEGLLPLENRSLEEGISLAVDELNLISRKDAVKYIVFLLNEVGDEDQLALAKLSQEHPDFHLLVKLYPSEEEASTVEELMGIIRDDLIRTVKAGSYVESRLAKNFALMEDPSVTSLTVGGTTLQAEYGDVEYGETCCFRFGDKYELHYYGPEETDYPYFVLKIGEDKLADTTLTLRFQVKLVYPEYPTQAGVTTYGTYDPYGLSGYEGIAVTGETRLVALNASGKVESTEFFRVPTVSYTALLLEGQYGNEEVHYFTSDMAGTEYDYQLDDQSWHVSVFTDGMNTILDIE